MDSLFNILANRNFDEPPEVASIKKFVFDNYQTDVSVAVRDKDISITVPSAALASTLRMRLPEMKRRCQIDKKILLRIG
ncbi:MAG: hypothetical protein JWM81_694 [Candidatus Saccharibacteria bacterium]|nr:hypothetical protein [Candidatus Saccharibacteria bacterium]